MTVAKISCFGDQDFGIVSRLVDISGKKIENREFQAASWCLVYFFPECTTGILKMSSVA